MKYFDEIIKPALENLYKNDVYLIKENVHEQAISHHLAKYIEETIRDYGSSLDNELNFIDIKVDCEFNRDIGGLKRTRNRYKYSDRPDIIVHKRGDNRNNKFVIELKKGESECDKCKVKNIVMDLGYEEGYVIQKIKPNSLCLFHYKMENSHDVASPNEIVEKRYDVTINNGEVTISISQRNS